MPKMTHHYGPVAQVCDCGEVRKSTASADAPPGWPGARPHHVACKIECPINHELLITKLRSQGVTYYTCSSCDELLINETTRRGRSDMWVRNDPDLIPHNQILDSDRLFLLTAPNRTDLYWRVESRGYTMQIAEAGIYSRREAEAIVNNKRGDQMIPLRKFEETIKHLIKQCDEHKKSLLEMQEMLKDG